MSLILDALNRAENERKNQNSVPDINTLHRPQALDVKPGPRRIWWGVGAVLVLVTIMGAYFALRGETRVPATPVANVASSQAAVVAPAINVVAVQTSSAAQISTAQVSTASAIPIVEASPQPQTPSADVNKLYSEDAEAPTAVDAGVNELYAAEAATTAASETIVDPFNAMGSAPVAVQEQEPQRTFDSIKNIPDFNALPWNMRQNIPTISYARHNFLVNGVSSVVINNQTAGVGNIIGTGQFIVQEIVVDGVVLKHGNAVFKLRALTGWINM